MNAATKKSLRRFGRFIVTRRKELKIPRAELIRRSGLALSVIQKIEQGHANPTFVTLKKLTSTLNFQLRIHPGTPIAPRMASAAQVDDWLRSPPA